jgi:hypothetical protein
MLPNEYRTDISQTTTIKRQRTLEAADNRPKETPPIFDIPSAAEHQGVNCDELHLIYRRQASTYRDLSKLLKLSLTTHSLIVRSQLLA